MALRAVLLGGGLAVLVSSAALAQAPDTAATDAAVKRIEPKLSAWRRDFHTNPELGNNEVRTAKVVAAHLKSLGLEVRTGVAKTGVIGILRGGKPGAVVALRSDMDALPVEEKTGLAFASKVTAQFGGKTVPVMHACGHDGHMAMLMGAAEVLAAMKADIPGTIVFIFQPAEEGPPPGEKGGAPLMVAEGALDNPKPDAIFGVHLMPGPAGRIDVRPGPFFAGSDTFRVTYTGRGTHGAMPWAGIDVISLSAATIGAFNTIAARQVDITEAPTIITIGSLQAGTRFNVIPDTATLDGTLRSYGAERRKDAMMRIERNVNDLAHSYGATAEIKWMGSNPAVENNEKLLAEILPALEAAAGAKGVNTNARVRTVSEDFSYFTKLAPTVFWNLGSTPNFTSLDKAVPNHSPQFDIDEAALPYGVKAHVNAALAFLAARAK